MRICVLGIHFTPVVRLRGLEFAHRRESVVVLPIEPSEHLKRLTPLLTGSLAREVFFRRMPCSLISMALGRQQIPMQYATPERYTLQPRTSKETLTVLRKVFLYPIFEAL